MTEQNSATHANFTREQLETAIIAARAIVQSRLKEKDFAKYQTSIDQVADAIRNYYAAHSHLPVMFKKIILFGVPTATRLSNVAHVVKDQLSIQSLDDLTALNYLHGAQKLGKPKLGNVHAVGLGAKSVHYFIEHLYASLVDPSLLSAANNPAQKPTAPVVPANVKSAWQSATELLAKKNVIEKLEFLFTLPPDITGKNKKEFIELLSHAAGQYYTEFLTEALIEDPHNIAVTRKILDTIVAHKKLPDTEVSETEIAKILAGIDPDFKKFIDDSKYLLLRSHIAAMQANINEGKSDDALLKLRMLGKLDDLIGREEQAEDKEAYPVIKKISNALVEATSALVDSLTTEAEAEILAINTLDETPSIKEEDLQKAVKKFTQAAETIARLWHTTEEHVIASETFASFLTAVKENSAAIPLDVLENILTKVDHHLDERDGVSQLTIEHTKLFEALQKVMHDKRRGMLKNLVKTINRTNTPGAD